MRDFAKYIADWIAFLMILPAVACYQFGVWMLGPARAFPGWSQLLSLLPGLTGVYLRRAFYRRVLSGCGDGTCIAFGSVFSHPTASLGRSVYIGLFCSLGDVSLGDDVLLGSHVSIMNGNAQHGIARLDVPIREQPGDWPRITIGRDTWIGDRAIVFADVGHHCVIGAGSIVTSPIPEYAIAVGVPAKVIRYRQGGDSTAERRSAAITGGAIAE
jgi:virginiamycin A acetyltransferase